MNLLRPVRRWMARSLLDVSPCFEDFAITQEDIDRDLLKGAPSAAFLPAEVKTHEETSPRITALTWIPEGPSA